MAFVRLNRSGQSVWINSDRIAYFEPVESLAQDGSKRAETKVCFDSEMSIVVDEPIDFRVGVAGEIGPFDADRSAVER